MKSSTWRIHYKANFKKLVKTKVLFFESKEIVDCTGTYECTEWFREPVEMYLDLALDICMQHFVKVADIDEIIPNSTTLNPYYWEPV